MKIGYPSINLSIDRRAGRPFVVLQRRSARALNEAKANIGELEQILQYNLEHNLMFFRIRPDLIPFASDPKVDVDWQKELGDPLRKIGGFIRAHNMRINIHPDLYTMINHPDQQQLNNAIRDLHYQAELLDLMELDSSAKIQVHVGERFSHDKEASIRAFEERFVTLDDVIKRRMVIENENVMCTFKDCLGIHVRTGLPIVPDVLHHEITGGSDGIRRVLELASETWGACDGMMMVDYSSQDPGRMTGKHAPGIKMEHFKAFIDASLEFDFDLMMEHKDRESSALKAYEYLKDDPRVRRGLTEPPAASCD